MVDEKRLEGVCKDRRKKGEREGRKVEGDQKGGSRKFLDEEMEETRKYRKKGMNDEVMKRGKGRKGAEKNRRWKHGNKKGKRKKKGEELATEGERNERALRENGYVEVKRENEMEREKRRIGMKP